ncbi:class I SAM-dependent methyltransferase [Alphaproteobacteria bacterium GH1-50]|uniref:Class I SAM-dependent methyltransferase n=1 Tax=Kangsaoukella pontilimi TaxID=2691042 RepID=A0A7C9IGB7_9RHOB|nr:class I SAM-dependent methyltransferase [Kangsaoukella pontilimi]MXQ08208.1 class I SAM-dependent methyltransferase [Kangsaoukella pontilimi]
MAIPDTLAARLIEVTKSHDLKGPFLMLGRQRFVGTRKGKAAKLLQDTIETYLPGLSEDDLRNPGDEYSETFFEKLGYSQVDSLDFSPFEGASIIQDLSGDLNPDLHGRFNTIYDGGTIEHIFELPTAYRNVDRMLKEGGVFIGHSPCNNWINHSFYQINPEMVYGFWEKAMGYKILHMILQPLLPNFSDRVVTSTNPNETGVRPRLSGKLPNNSPIMLCFAVQKPFGVQGSQRAYQTDYMEKWER